MNASTQFWTFLQGLNCSTRAIRCTWTHLIKGSIKISSSDLQPNGLSRGRYDLTGSFWTGLIERIDLERRSLRWPEGSGSAPSRSSPRCVRLRCSWHRVKAWPLPVRRPASPSRVVIGAWRDHYNRIRPHSALGYRPPAPVTRAFAHHLPTPNTMQ